MSGAIPPLPNTHSWYGAQLKAQGQLYLTFNFTFTFTFTFAQVGLRTGSLDAKCLMLISFPALMLALNL
jgi:hypothetical protein